MTGGVTRENYMLRCAEKLMEIREMPALLRSPRQKKTAGKRRRRGSGSCCCKADPEDTDIVHRKVKREYDHILMRLLKGNLRTVCFYFSI